MNTVVTTLSPSFLIGSPSFFAGNKDTHKISDGFEIGQYPTKDL